MRLDRWPNEPDELDVIDTWRGTSGYRWLDNRNAYQRVLALGDDGVVSFRSQRVRKSQMEIRKQAGLSSPTRQGEVQP